jgi:hypothetical protein
VSAIMWGDVLAGDVVLADDGLEWFVFDRSDRGEFALIRAGSNPQVGVPDATAEVELRYRGALGVAVELLGGVVISHDGADGAAE